MSIFSRMTGGDGFTEPSGKLAIVVPTFRFDARARYTLAATAALASDEIAVLIGDNSENPEKWAFLNRLAKLHPNIHVNCHRTNIGASRNWRALHEATGLPFCLCVSDDDVCTSEYVDCALALLEQHADAAVAAGRFMMVTSENQVIPANRGRLEATAYERCARFVIGGGNSLPNSMARRAALTPFLEYMNQHPLKASFFDWLMSYALLGAGKYYTADEGWYFYDVSNWENPTACWNANSGFYVAAGLPEQFTAFHELYWAVESSHYLRGGYSPIPQNDQRGPCAQAIYSNRIQAFRIMWDHTNRGAGLIELVQHRPRSAEALRMLALNDNGLHPELFDWFCELLAAFDTNCAIAYSDYIKASFARTSTPG